MTLIFYEVEEITYKKSYKKILDGKQIKKYHKQICKKYGVNTKLVINNKTFGYYDTDNNVINVPENVTLGVLIHEIAHAYEFKHFDDTFHKNRLFQIINEMNIYAERVI